MLTVRSDRSQRSFAPGADAIVGSDLRADLRVAHPLVAQAHVVVRFEQGNWIAIDNSRTGMFVDGRRVPLVDIRDGLVVNLGRPDGPRISFEVGHHRGIIGLLPQTGSPPPGGAPGGTEQQRRPPAQPPGAAPPAPGPPGYPEARRTTVIPVSPPPHSGDATPRRATSWAPTPSPRRHAGTSPGSAGRSTTTSSSPTCWHHATTLS
ncbi:FHA domain protein [Mycobacterium kansasii 732]|nr:FHA domain protein [Mycobacterium kansasii 732]